MVYWSKPASSDQARVIGPSPRHRTKPRLLAQAHASILDSEHASILDSEHASILDSEA